MVLLLPALSFRQIRMWHELRVTKLLPQFTTKLNPSCFFFLINVQLNASLTIWNTRLDQEILQT